MSTRPVEIPLCVAVLGAWRQRGESTRDPPWYVAALAAWQQRGDTKLRDALWVAAARAARAVEFARTHPHDARELARLQDHVLEALAEDAAAGLAVINWRLAERERLAKAPGGGSIPAAAWPRAMRGAWA